MGKIVAAVVVVVVVLLGVGAVAGEQAAVEPGPRGESATSQVDDAAERAAARRERQRERAEARAERRAGQKADQRAEQRAARAAELRRERQQARREQAAQERREQQRREERARQQAARATYVVTRVVDGDTLELGNGETVRLVGIDTPEVGECGFEQASARLGELALGRSVTLAASDEDRDYYGRLLRYVDVGAVDAGLTLIREGLAIARYDSRDGYGWHPREATYVNADRDSARGPGCGQRAPQPLVGNQGQGACAPGYQPCVPPGPPDLDCADLDGPIRVTGADPHALDGDGDGVACE
jgi:endonuclease YncB( thermonuclease family)